MDAIKSSIQRLNNVPTKNWKGKKDAEDSTIQVSSIVRLLELPSASTVTFTRLSQILRTRLIPLYHASLSLALDFAIATFLFLHNNQNIPALQSGNSQESWEALLMALLSGILDFFDEISSGKIRETVALALYPILCPRYFCQPSQPPLKHDGELLSLVYQTLVATVDCHPKNTVNLRDSDVGRQKPRIYHLTNPRHVGRQLTCVTSGLSLDIVDFLALESLLDLFGLLIPPLKGGRDKRSCFIKEVFDPAFFSHSSNRIVEHLESTSTPDWSIISEKLIGLLAEQDISSPQPFEAFNFVLNTHSMDGCSSVYIDRTRIIANIHKDGKIETLHVLFVTILGVVTSTISVDEIHVVISISQPPMLGNEAMSMASDDDMQLSFTMKKLHMSRFGSVLKSRNIMFRHLGNRKLSKGRPIELDFAPHNQDFMLLTQQERLQIVTQNIQTSPQRPDRVLNSNSRSKVERAVCTPFNPTEMLTSLGSPLSKSFVDPDGIKPPLQIDEPGSRENKPSGLVLQLQLPQIQPQPTAIVPEDDKFNAKLRSSHVMRERRALIFDDPDNASENNSTVSPIDTEAFSELRSSSLKRAMLLTSRSRPTTRSTTRSTNAPSNKNNKQINSTKETKMKTESTNVQYYNNVVQAKKRSLDDIEENAADIKAHEERPTKRVREQSLVPSPIRPIRPYRRKKYGRRGHTPSTVQRTSLDVDFDELPQTPNKFYVSEMKDKNGEHIPKAKPAPSKGDTKWPAMKASGTRMENERIKSLASSDEFPPLRDIKPKTEVERVTRQSARITKLQTPDPDPVRKPSKKSKKASWDETILLEKSNQLSDDVVLPADPIRDSNDGSNFWIEDVQIYDASVDSIDNVVPESHTKPSPNISKYVRSRSSNSPKEAVIIDLTHEASLDGSKINNTPRSTTHIRNPLPTRTLSGEHDKESQQGIDVKMSHPKIVESRRISYEDEDRSILALSKTQQQKSFATDAFPVVSEVMKGRASSTTFPSSLQTPQAKIVKINIRPRLLEHKPEDKLFDHIAHLGVETPTQTSHKIRLPTESPKKYKVLDNKIPGAIQCQRLEYHRMPRRSESKEDPMEKIVEILHQINDVIIHKIERRFDVVTEGLHVGQRIILEGIAKNLHGMHQESILYFNQMVDLEEQYTVRSSRIVNATHDYIKSNDQLSQCLKAIIIDHNRRCLSKKLPESLFPRIPASISNPVLGV